MKLKFFIFLLTMSFCSFAQTLTLAPLQVPKFNLAKLNASGGPYTTQDADLLTLFTNPALFSSLQKKWSISALAFNGRARENASSFLTEMSLVGPIAFGLTNTNFAFGIFNTTRLERNIDKANNKYDLIFGEELFLTGGYGAKVFDNGNHSISLGIQMKGYFQGFSVERDATWSGTPAPYSNLFSSLSDANPVMLTCAIGLDVGFLYNYADFVKFGFTVQDAYTATFSTMYANAAAFKASSSSGGTKYRSPIPVMNAGFSIQPKLPENYSTFTRYIFWFDYCDFLSPLRNKRSILYNISFGMEFEFNKAYYIRLGLRELSPSFGVGVDAGFFDLNTAASLSLKTKAAGSKTQPGFTVDFAIKL